MIDVAHLKQLFNQKLRESGSLDEAFLKAVWVAYKQGLADQPTLNKEPETPKNDRE